VRVKVPSWFQLVQLEAVTAPMESKVRVVGAGESPLYPDAEKVKPFAPAAFTPSPPEVWF
jgi:hypothetical protein